MTKAVIETPRLQLREMVWEDRESIAAILQDERVMYAYEGAFDDAHDFLQSFDGDHRVFADVFQLSDRIGYQRPRAE